jgi:nicotinamide-nucleotide amidase
LKAEIVSVGTELLLGAITDTNATYLAQRLAALGIDLFHVSQVGDNVARIVEVLDRAWKRSDLVVTTGGLGPTQDDLTRESIAQLLGEVLVVSPELEEHLRGFYSRRGVAMPESNLKQATLIASAQSISNPLGTAPGWLVKGQYAGSPRVIVSMPGVPFEMRSMWERQVEPLLETASGAVIVSKTLKTLGIGESRVEELVSDLMQSTDPTLAPYAKSDGVHLRITAKASDRIAAQKKIEAMEAAVRDRLGDMIYGAEVETPLSVLSTLLNDFGRQFMIVEIGPLAAGALGQILAEHPYCAGAIFVPHLELFGKLLSMSGSYDSAEAVARAVTSLQVPLVIVLQVAAVTVVDDISVNVNSEVVISFGPPACRLAQTRSTWRTAATEVARLSGLAALNLLRKELREALRIPEGSVA